MRSYADRNGPAAVTSQGSPYARFRRALSNGNPLMITVACAELPHVSLADALEVCLAFRDVAPDRYGRASARWLARYITERHADDNEAAFLLACLRALPAPVCAPAAAHALRVHLSRRGLSELARVVERWAHRSGLADT
jgi:hypothetical protein